MRYPQFAYEKNAPLRPFTLRQCSLNALLKQCDIKTIRHKGIASYVSARKLPSSYYISPCMKSPPFFEPPPFFYAAPNTQPLATHWPRVGKYKTKQT